MRNHLGRIRIVAKLQRHPATFPYMIFLHRWPFCIRDHFAYVFVLTVTVIVRFAIESFCSVFSCLFRDWDCWFYKDHRSFFNFYMFYEYNRLFCRNVFFTLSAAHISDFALGQHEFFWLNKSWCLPPNWAIKLYNVVTRQQFKQTYYYNTLGYDINCNYKFLRKKTLKMTTQSCEISVEQFKIHCT